MARGWDNFLQAGIYTFMSDILTSELAATETTVRSAATGDEVAFARLVAEHHTTMSRVAFVICSDREAARDAVQSAWAIAWRRIGSLRDPRQIRPWLVAIAVNEARQVRRRRRRQPVVDISKAVALVAADGDPTESVEMLDLRRVLDGLKPEDIGLLAMRFTAGLDSAEIADQLGMSASGVRSRLARLLDRLRDDLALEPERDE
jgi:RNA polymerase sigma-70 factor (ECF subfamily)